MSVRNLKDKSKNPWLCECYPQGREGKRIRKRFSTKGEAITFERFTMREIEEKPWLAQKTDNRRLLDILKLWWCLHGHSVKTGRRNIGQPYIFGNREMRSTCDLFTIRLSITDTNENNNSTTRGW